MVRGRAQRGGTRVWSRASSEWDGRVERDTSRRVTRLFTVQEAAMAQEQTKRGGGGDDDDFTDTTAAGQERREKLAEDTDDLLDEIDDVLEENAEDFVRAYVQKGGQ